jgi:hypothetical protein
VLHSILIALRKPGAKSPGDIDFIRDFTTLWADAVFDWVLPFLGVYADRDYEKSDGSVGDELESVLHVDGRSHIVKAVYL